MALKEKRTRYHRSRRLYEAWSTGHPSKFKLEEPNISLIQPLLVKLGPDGIHCEECVKFGLDFPDPEEPYVEALMACAYDIGTNFNTVTAGSMSLVVDTGASSSVTPNIPRFSRRARKGNFLECSNKDGSLVARVSTPFHVVFDDHLSTIYSDMTLEETSVEGIFNDLFESCTDCYGEETIAASEGANTESPIEEDPNDLSPELGSEL